MKHEIKIEFSSPDIDERDLQDYGLSPWEAWRYIELGEDRTVQGDYFNDIVAEIADNYVPVYYWGIYNTWVHVLPDSAKDAAVEEGLVDGKTTIDKIMQMDICLYLEDVVQGLLDEWAERFSEIWDLYEKLFPDGEPEDDWEDNIRGYIYVVFQEMKRVYKDAIPEWLFDMEDDVDHYPDKAIELVESKIEKYRKECSNLKDYKAVMAELAVLRTVLDAYFAGNMWDFDKKQKEVAND